jgi:formylglycine-generating enzyme required for sulfatase activity
MIFYILLVLGGAVPPGGSSAAAEGMRTISPCPGCPTMVVVPTGQFVMGDDNGFSENERPATGVDMPRSFALGRTEVTFDDWNRCVEAQACRAVTNDHGWGKGRRPVINITWDDARRYAEWLGRRAGLTCRLPTEAEWEYAARAGTTTAYPWGAELGTGNANCRNCLGGDPHEIYGSRPAASFPPNPWGLHDMAGNVWEWTADCWTPNHAARPEGGACTDRVIKGGSWYYFAPMSRPAARARNGATVWSYNIGFRVLCELR